MRKEKYVNAGFYYVNPLTDITFGNNVPYYANYV
jgi:hypothetical protein